MKFEEIQKPLLQYFEEHSIIRILLPFNLIIMFASLVGIAFGILNWFSFRELYSCFLVIFLFALVLTSVKGDFRMSCLALLIKLGCSVLSLIVFKGGFLHFVFGLCSVLLYAYLTYQVYNKCKNI